MKLNRVAAGQQRNTPIVGRAGDPIGDPQHAIRCPVEKRTYATGIDEKGATNGRRGCRAASEETLVRMNRLLHHLAARVSHVRVSSQQRPDIARRRNAGLQLRRAICRQHVQVRKLADNTVAQRVAVLRFFYSRVLKRAWHMDTYPKKRKRLPIIPSREEVERLIESTVTPFHRAILMVLYARAAAARNWPTCGSPTSIRSGC
jgi:hypothetical protein